MNAMGMGMVGCLFMTCRFFFGGPSCSHDFSRALQKWMLQEVSNHDMSVSSALRSVLRSVAKPKRKAVAAIFVPPKNEET